MNQSGSENVIPAKVRPPETPHEGLRDELLELLDVVGPGKLGDVVLDRAFELNATDLHLEPTASGFRIRA